MEGAGSGAKKKKLNKSRCTASFYLQGALLAHNLKSYPQR